MRNNPRVGNSSLSTGRFHHPLPGTVPVKQNPPQRSRASAWRNLHPQRPIRIRVQFQLLPQLLYCPTHGLLIQYAYKNRRLLVIFSGTATSSLLHVLPLDATSTATTERRAQGKIDVFLGVQTDNEAGDVHQLLADATKRESRAKWTNTNCTAEYKLCDFCQTFGLRKTNRRSSQFK